MASSLAPCVKCGHAFQLNSELATIPDASRIAFDPALRRAWRICASCGEWNLLGTEAADRAMPELVARFAAAPKRAGGAGVAPAHVGRTLELLQVGSTVVAANDAAILRRRRRLGLLKWVGVFGLVFGVVALSADAMLAWHWGVLSHMVIQFVPAAPYTYLAYVANRRRHRLPVKLWPVLPSLAIIVAGYAILSRYDRFWIVHPIVMVLFYGIAALVLPPFSFFTVHLSDGRVVRMLSSAAVKRISISWDDSSAITVHGVPEGGTLTGTDAVIALRRLLAARNLVYVGRAVSDAAYDLVRTAGGLTGVLRALEGFRQDGGGRVVIADLPKVYIVALDLALSDIDERPGAFGRLGRKAVAASVIAQEAEALDAGAETERRTSVLKVPSSFE